MASAQTRLGWILGLALLVFGASRLVTSESGQALLVRYGVSDYFGPQLATRLDVVLGDSFLEMGLLRSNLRFREVEDPEPLREYRFTAPPHLTPTQCHLWIQRAARRERAEIVRGEQGPRHRRDIVLHLGYGEWVTHRIVIQPAPPPEAPAGKPEKPMRIVLVIDDFGHNLNTTARGFLELGFPLTLAILPDVPKSRAAFEAAREHGLPTLLHLPMEPDGPQNPGSNAVRVGMTDDEIDALIEHHHKRYPDFIGINNHMGSRATADPKTMRALMRALRKRDLVFVDSQTTPHSLGRKMGRETGVWNLTNDLFLDDDTESAEDVAHRLEELAALAKKTGLAVGIAHPRPKTLQALRALLPRLQAEGFEFVTVETLRPQTLARPNRDAS